MEVGRLLVVVSRGCRIRCNGTRGLSGRVMIWVAVPHPFFLEETEARHEGVAIGTGPQKVQSPNPERPNEWVGKGGGVARSARRGLGRDEEERNAASRQRIPCFLRFVVCRLSTQDPGSHTATRAKPKAESLYLIAEPCPGALLSVRSRSGGCGREPVWCRGRRSCLAGCLLTAAMQCRSITAQTRNRVEPLVRNLKLPRLMTLVRASVCAPCRGTLGRIIRRRSGSRVSFPSPVGHSVERQRD